jgi:hypothetical protein
MFDAIADVIEILLTGEVPSPDTLEKQRQARLAVSAVGLVVDLGLSLWLGASTLRGWSFLVVAGMTIAAGWALIVSVIDLVKELPSVEWLSVAAAGVATVGIAIPALLALGMMPAAG